MMLSGVVGEEPLWRASFLCKMKYQISKNGYKAKPTDPEFKNMEWVEKDTDLPDLVELLANGHIYRANLNNTLNYNTKNLVSAQVVMIDVDGKHNPPKLDEFLKKTLLRPTFYYETFNSVGGERYRLGYMLDKEIKTKEEYSAIAHIILEKTGCLVKGMVDPVSFSAVQNIAGTNKPVHNNHCSYRKSDFDRLLDSYLPEVKVSRKFDLKLSFEEYDTRCDFLSFEGTFENYINLHPIDKVLLKESLPDDEDETFFYWSDYKCLLRKLANGSYYHKYGDYYVCNTFHDGEGRRRKLTVNCSLIHQMYPDCTLEELLVLTCKCFLKYFTNDAQDTIDREFVFNTVVAEMHCPLNARSPYTIKKRFKVKMYDEKGKRVHWKVQAKEYYSNQILGMYDASLSVEDNLILIQRYYDESKDKHQVSLRTLRRYLDENNVFYFSSSNNPLTKEKPITVLKRMIKCSMIKEAYQFLLEHRESISKNQYFKYKKYLLGMTD